jgi:anti-sigma B factor antagonist
LGDSRLSFSAPSPGVRDIGASLLVIEVAVGEAGPVIILSGEADMTTVTQLEDALDAQVAAAPAVLTVDLSGLRFADSATITAVVRAARALKERGGRLDLAAPQLALARVLGLLGVDQVLAVHHDRPRLRPDMP